MIDSKILEFAQDISNYGLQNTSKNFASIKNKKCGDRIKVELEVKNKIIKNMRYETESCIFCQASASILAKHIKKNKVKNIKNLTSFKNFKFLLSKRYLSRKECVMLPIDAVKKAIK